MHIWQKKKKKKRLTRLDSERVTELFPGKGVKGCLFCLLVFLPPPINHVILSYQNVNLSQRFILIKTNPSGKNGSSSEAEIISKLPRRQRVCSQETRAGTFTLTGRQGSVGDGREAGASYGSGSWLCLPGPGAEQLTASPSYSC